MVVVEAAAGGGGVVVVAGGGRVVAVVVIAVMMVEVVVAAVDTIVLGIRRLLSESAENTNPRQSSQNPCSPTKFPSAENLSCRILSSAAPN